jgi:hypothetical protein
VAAVVAASGKAREFLAHRSGPHEVIDRPPEREPGPAEAVAASPTGPESGRIGP